MFMKFAAAIMLAVTTMAGAATAGNAAGGNDIDRSVATTLEHFYGHAKGGQALVAKARGVLVFPNVIKAGFGIGGEYGEGALRIDGRQDGYYNLVSGSIGFQLGVESRSIIILFMTDKALTDFRKVNGFNIGVDGSVAVLTLGAGASLEINKITDPVLGFILDTKGLMYNLTLEGSKISRISR